ncbi:DUF4864 domain-containing protein [Hydrogenophaga sp. A37]|uniref:DUF4864 domain-containing protein n=1 Tax=Hydrogenophaga sp. A37 TaxID=1945864 RepID=UPI00098710C9|nr:DUF4864 domain-containing protein [Hydrogenophaga sp. A37]OOG87674.1 hypothetical protein B0E41_03910 [Hydrogenophaga sp. A37]
MPAALRPEALSRRWLVRWVLVLCMALAASAGAAGELPDAQAKAVRAVVQAQLDAFANDDAERAFSYAAPSLHELFGDASTFMAMVQGQYGMLVKPESVLFLIPESVHDDVIQEVLLRDSAGRLWRAAYRLELTAENGWRINGCAVRPDDGRSSA